MILNRHFFRNMYDWMTEYDLQGYDVSWLCGGTGCAWVLRPSCLNPVVRDGDVLRSVLSSGVELHGDPSWACNQRDCPGHLTWHEGQFGMYFGSVRDDWPSLWIGHQFDMSHVFGTDRLDRLSALGFFVHIGQIGDSFLPGASTVIVSRIPIPEHCYTWDGSFSDGSFSDLDSTVAHDSAILSMYPVFRPNSVESIMIDILEYFELSADDKYTMTIESFMSHLSMIDRKRGHYTRWNLTPVSVGVALNRLGLKKTRLRMNNGRKYLYIGIKVV